MAPPPTLVSAAPEPVAPGPLDLGEGAPDGVVQGLDRHGGSSTAGHGPEVSLIVTPASPSVTALKFLEDRMAIRQSDAIEVRRVKGKGRGVFARRLIRKGEVIEIVPVLVLPSRGFENGLAGTGLANHVFAW